jgi:glycyl-tRNA synthetase (class II)
MAAAAVGRGVGTAKEILNFAGKHGFLWQSSSIYGGLSGCFDFGPLGTELKRNIVREWYGLISFTFVFSSCRA